MCQEDPFDYSSITKLNMVKKNKNSMIKPGGKIHKKKTSFTGGLGITLILTLWYLIL